ncbi:MAG: WxcM-like domain-containing protein [Bacteroidota bacterium]
MKSISIKEKIKIIKRRKIEDSRGWFLKVIDGKEANLPSHTGEVYLTMALPGEIKGGHYHNKANEWFTLIEGKCEVRLEDMETKERYIFSLEGREPLTLFVPAKIAHAFVNNEESTKFILLAYTDQLYDPVDTIPYQL